MPSFSPSHRRTYRARVRLTIDRRRWPWRNVAEIEADAALQAYGAFLAVTHVLTAMLWARVQPLTAVLDPATFPICWPFFEDCWAWRILGRSALIAVLGVYAGLAVATFVAFTLGAPATAAAWSALLLTSTLKLAILVQDYRFRLNQHYMALWMMVVFLFVPHKRRVLPVLLVAFYVAAGLLKLNADWLSGAALLGSRPYFVPKGLVPLACAYVVVLQLGVAPFLLAERAWLFWPAFAQIVAFHVASWGVVGFFYPTLMLALLTIFPLARFIPPPHGEGDARLVPLLRGREVRSAYAVLGVFAALQALPLLYPGDPAVTGEGRLFALHMFDAPIECRGTATLHRTGGTEQVELSTVVPARIRCDPIVYWNLANGLCRRNAASPDFQDLDLELRSKRPRDEALRPVVAVESFCRTRPGYDLWRHNAWIGAR